MAALGLEVDGGEEEELATDEEEVRGRESLYIFMHVYLYTCIYMCVCEGESVCICVYMYFIC
jgi:hypothetical protein